MTQPTRPSAYHEFIRLFNERKYFEAHEILESRWRRETGAARDFYHGLIQIAAAFVHVQKQNPKGAERLFQSSLGYLSKYFPEYLGLNLEQLYKDIKRRGVESAEFPRIYLKETGGEHGTQEKKEEK